MRTRTTAALLALTPLLASPLIGCTGHGKYTQEGVSLAKARLDALRAATEYDMGMQAFLAGDLDKAARKARAARELTADNPKIAVLEGRISVEQGRMGEALLALRRATELDEEHVQAHYYLGVVYERLREHEPALTHFKRAAELEPYNAQYPVAAGEMLIDLGRIEEARVYLEGHESGEHAAGVQQLLGHIARIENDHQLACDYFSRARLLAPIDRAIMTDLAESQMAAARYADAELNLAHLLLDPDHKDRRDLRHLRAECLVALDRPVEARDIYRSLASGDGESDTRAWTGLARAAYRIGDEEGFRRAASRVIAIDPRDAQGYVLFAAMQHDQGDLDGAIETVDRGLISAGRTPDLLSMRALVLADQNRLGEALSAAHAALDLDPEHRATKRLLDRLAVVAVPVD